MSPAAGQLDLDIGATIKLKSTPEVRTDNMDADFESGNHNNTMSINNSVSLNRAGDPQGVLDLYSGTGKSSNIVKDENGGLHIAFHDNLGVASGGPSGTRLKYKFSGNGGESWTTVPINISTSVSGLQEYGDYQDLAIDTTNQRLHLVFRAKGTGNYVALMTTACSYSGGGGCLTWPLAHPL